MKRRSILERFAAELQLDIIELLDYQGAIRLSQVNHHFHATVDPQGWPLNDKKAFVKGAMSWAKHRKFPYLYTKSDNKIHRSAKCNLACFTCFRVKPMSAFATRQVRTGRHRRVQRGEENCPEDRCCIDCNINKASFRHGQRLTLILQTSLVYDEPAYRADFKVHKSRSKVFCAECKELHDEGLWASLECFTQRSNEKSIKRAHRRELGEQRKPGNGWVRGVPPGPLHFHKKNFVERSEAGRHCGVCGDCEPHSYLGDLYCPTCMIWVCHSCCLSSSLGPWARCGSEGSKHILTDGCYDLEVHEKLVKAQKSILKKSARKSVGAGTHDSVDGLDGDVDLLGLDLLFGESDSSERASDKAASEGAQFSVQAVVDGERSVCLKLL